MLSDPYAPRTPEELRRISDKEGVRTPEDLTPQERRFSPSKWGLRHLLACRLLVTTGMTRQEFLPSLKMDHKDKCPVCLKAGQVIDQSNTDELTVPGVWPTSSHLRKSTFTRLFHSKGGFFWAALARASRLPVTMADTPHPQRQRTPFVRPGFVNTIDVVPCSSPPAKGSSPARTLPSAQSPSPIKSTRPIDSSSPTKPSGSEYSDSFNSAEAIDQDEHDTLRDVSEDTTVHLIMCFLQFVLHLCLKQDTAGTEICPRLERRRSTLPYALGEGKVSAVDDGGICTMSFLDRQQHWELLHPYLAIIEAKRSFNNFVSDSRDSDRVYPVASTKMIAQYLGEALAAWFSSPNSGNKYVAIVL
jgi:hypothetical protein